VKHPKVFSRARFSLRKVPGLPADIRQGWTSLSGTNARAHYKKLGWKTLLLRH